VLVKALKFFTNFCYLLAFEFETDSQQSVFVGNGVGNGAIFCRYQQTELILFDISSLASLFD